MNKSMKRYLIGCDIGTSATKAVLINDEGVVLSSHYAEHNVYVPRDGYVEHDAQEYWKVFTQNMRAVIRNAGVDPRDVAGVGVSSCAPCCVLVDKNGNPLSRVQIWMDRRGDAECDIVRRAYSQEELFDVCANPLDAHNGTIKLLWVKNHQPEIYKETYKMLSPANYINFRLTGKCVTDYSNASLISVVFDIRKCEWRTDMIEKIGLDPDKFSEVAPCNAVIGTVTRKAALECGLAEGTPVVAGTVDSNAAWLSNGSSFAGDASFVMGTAGCMCVLHHEPVFPRRLMNSVHLSKGKVLYSTLAGTANCGGLLRYMRDCFAADEAAALSDSGSSIFEKFSEEAASVPPGSEGLVVLPYISGERTPLWDPYIRGAVFGISLCHKRAHWIRAMMESAVYAVYDCLKQMQEVNLDIRDTLIVSEGGANSPIWRQITADVMNINVGFMQNAKGAPTGDAINAGVGVGLFQDFDIAKQFVSTDIRNVPDSKAHEVYERYFTFYKKLCNDNRLNFDRLRELREQ